MSVSICQNFKERNAKYECSLHHQFFPTGHIFKPKHRKQGNETAMYGTTAQMSSKHEIESESMTLKVEMRITTSLLPAPTHEQTKGTNITNPKREARCYSANFNKYEKESETTKCIIQMALTSSTIPSSTHVQAKAT